MSAPGHRLGPNALTTTAPAAGRARAQVELLGRTPAIAFDGFRHGLVMLRYDWSAFMPLEDNLTPRLVAPLKKFPSW